MALEDKKALIHDQIGMISEKLKMIKGSAENIQSQVTKILEELMNTLMTEV
jgi:endonuclease III